MSNSRQLKKLSLKLQYLREEIVDAREDFDTGKWELNIAVLEAFARSGNKVQTAPAAEVGDSSQYSEKTEDVQKSDDEFCKKVFRRIAIVAHPDKLIGRAESERLHFEEVYKSAAQAVREGDRIRLIEIANSLDIEIDIGDEEQIASLEMGAEKIEKSIEEIKSTMQFAWHKSKDDIPRRVAMLRAVTQHMGVAIDDLILERVVHWTVNGFPGGTSYGEEIVPRARPVPPPRPPGTRPENTNRRK